MKGATLDALLEAGAGRKSLVRLVWLDDGHEQLVASSAELGDDASLSRAVDGALASDRGQLLETGGRPVFVHPFTPALRLVIIGAVHIAQRLSVLARDLGYRVTIVDPRRGFLTAARFPGVALSHAWPLEALDAHGLDEHCALVALSHDPKIDEPALEVGLRSACFYIGALGSQRTQAKRRARLLEAGIDEAALERIHGPVGLDIGARGPAEIALSIAAEMTGCLRKPT
ncbi:MAG: hypothetical protein CL908_25920 [Deltaproteobacteria bacterium]|nr:hypothetical protein [Deltaproteobacteria bacterium]